MYIIYILQVNFNGVFSFGSGKNVVHLYLCDICLNPTFNSWSIRFKSWNKYNALIDLVVMVRSPPQQAIYKIYMLLYTWQMYYLYAVLDASTSERYK